MKSPADYEKADCKTGAVERMNEGGLVVDHLRSQHLFLFGLHGKVKTMYRPSHNGIKSFTRKQTT
jgi:hypothetical protein